MSVIPAMLLRPLVRAPVMVFTIGSLESKTHAQISLRAASCSSISPQFTPGVSESRGSFSIPGLPLGLTVFYLLLGATIINTRA